MAEIGDRLCGAFVVRCYAEDRTMFAGTLDRPPLPVGSEEIWVVEFQLLDLRRFRMPDEYSPRRIDQVLTEGLDPTTLRPIL